MTPPTKCLYCGADLVHEIRPGAVRKFCCPQHRTLYNNDRNSTRRDPSKPIVRRKKHAPHVLRDSCEQCGKSLAGTRRHRFCSGECSEKFWNESRKKGVVQHLLSNVTGDCSVCGPGVPLLRAGTRPSRITGGQRWKCRETERTEPRRRTQRENAWKRKGIVLTVEQYEAMLAEQEQGCAICRASLSEHGRAPHVDHDHESGLVRGVLCEACNLGLGKFGDDPQRLRAAADYLEHATTAARP